MKKVLGLISVLAVGIAPLAAQSQSQPQPQAPAQTQPQAQSQTRRRPNPNPKPNPKNPKPNQANRRKAYFPHRGRCGGGRRIGRRRKRHDDRSRFVAPDFVVKIDGQPRRVVSADHVRIDIEAAKREAANPFETLFTTNLKPPNGRMFVIAVDQARDSVRRGARPPRNRGQVSRSAQSGRPHRVRRLP